ncbi:CUGBP Elav-like family member 2 [Armadillidium nasatum]|uniref:CUGBP Elav-like family member 2 n=1 Tax=Armadillidium nasatum TaxID=96803 RepID=A0A5N5TC70_9CRUS|nr:CUGBP Elav-like family member 2 [Armadillidium nasatum]
MLTKRFNEQEVRNMFSQYGTIEECTVLRDANGQSKGCAFVTFSSRQCAINAIKKMHHSQTMEGCSSPVVVKFADTQKEKDAKRLQQNLWGMTSTPNSLAALSPQYLALLQQQINSTNTGATGGLGALAGSIPQISSLNNISVQQLLAASQGNLSSQQIFDSQNLGSLSSLSGLNLPNSANGSHETSLQGLLASMTAQNTVLAGLATSPGGFSSALTSSLTSSTSSATTGKQIEGPEGANLFIYHLPQEFTDQELAQAFWPFGKVISAKVFIDKQTNLSKCFGFVSYDNALDAQRAIQHMNGQQIGNKRLKVQLKRSKNDSKPY